MMCLRCGYQKSGADQFFVCDDCKKFGPQLLSILDEADAIFDREEVLDPTADDKRVLQLLADTSFLNVNNPQTAIYYSISSYFLKKASDGSNSITETELNKAISTTRSWTDVLEVFEDLGLIRVRMDRYSRVIDLTDKMRKLANQFLPGNPRNEEVILRHAHFYAGYAMLHVLGKMAKVETVEQRDDLPYGKGLRTLWTVLMFMWGNAYSNVETFSDMEFDKFLAVRRIGSRARNNIIQRLLQFDGRASQTLISDVDVSGSDRTFRLNEYVLREMERIREVTRERERGSY